MYTYIYIYIYRDSSGLGLRRHAGGCCLGYPCAFLNRFFRTVSSQVGHMAISACESGQPRYGAGAASDRGSCTSVCGKSRGKKGEAGWSGRIALFPCAVRVGFNQLLLDIRGERVERAVLSKQTRKELRRHLRRKRTAKTAQILSKFSDLDRLASDRNCPFHTVEQAACNTPEPVTKYLSDIFSSEVTA